MRHMLRAAFHAWERRLADATTDRVVRPFDWGVDWIPSNGHVLHPEPARAVGDWVSSVMADTDRFYTPEPTTEYTVASAAAGLRLTFPSALVTPHRENNQVHCRFFPAASRAGTRHAHRAAVLVLPQWNADAGGHVGLCKLLS